MNIYVFFNDHKMAADGKFYIRVHKRGCQNIKKDDHIWFIEAESVNDAIAKQKQDFLDQDMGEFDYFIEPCVRK